MFCFAILSALELKIVIAQLVADPKHDHGKTSQSDGEAEAIQYRMDPVFYQVTKCRGHIINDHKPIDLIVDKSLAS
jgi:hypothetical protein